MAQVALPVWELRFVAYQVFYEENPTAQSLLVFPVFLVFPDWESII